MGRQGNFTTKKERMGMKSNTVRQKGQCTECGKPATHANECVMCHCATLSLAVIKQSFPADRIKAVTEDLCDTNLIDDAKDATAPGSVRRIAKTVTGLAFANRLQVRDLQREIVGRLRILCATLDAQTPESQTDFMARVNGWINNLKQHIAKT